MDGHIEEGPHLFRAVAVSAGVDGTHIHSVFVAFALLTGSRKWRQVSPMRSQQQAIFWKEEVFETLTGRDPPYLLQRV